MMNKKDQIQWSRPLTMLDRDLTHDDIEILRSIYTVGSRCKGIKSRYMWTMLQVTSHTSKRVYVKNLNSEYYDWRIKKKGTIERNLGYTSLVVEIKNPATFVEPMDAIMEGRASALIDVPRNVVSTVNSLEDDEVLMTLVADLSDRLTELNLAYDDPTVVELGRRFQRSNAP